jgi:5-methylcytosine-specific restriction endonuclease McrA
MTASVYFSDKPCLNGHVSPRYSSSRRCVACAKAAYNVDPMAIIVRSKKFRKNNPAAHNASVGRWRKNNPDKVKEARARYIARHPEVLQASARVRKHRRRSREASAGEFTRKELQQLWHRVPHRCAVCEVKITIKNRHVDHIQPLSRGGRNVIANIQFTCSGCNLKKGSRDPIEFMRSLGALL